MLDWMKAIAHDKTLNLVRDARGTKVLSSSTFNVGAAPNDTSQLLFSTVLTDMAADIDRRFAHCLKTTSRNQRIWIGRLNVASAQHSQF